MKIKGVFTLYGKIMTLFNGRIHFIVITLLLTRTCQNIVGTCDSSNTKTQCSSGQICTNKVCVTAVSCSTPSDCTASGLPPECSGSGYCQPDSCTTTGQCVHGQVCSSGLGHCATRLEYNVPEGTSEYPLKVSGRGGGSSFDQIAWFKGNSGNRIVIYIDGIGLIYKSDYCPLGITTCDYSDRGVLDISTATLKIKDLQYNDQGFYYFIYLTGPGEYVGSAYELFLTVYVEPSHPTLLGLEGILDTTEITFTCTVNRIRPAALDIYWLIHGQRINGSTENDTPNPDDHSIRQTNEVSYLFTKDQQGDTVHCVVVPQYGNQLTASTVVDLGYGASSPVGVIAGASAGGVVLCVIAVVACIVYWMRRRISKPEDERSAYEDTQVIPAVRTKNIGVRRNENVTERGTRESDPANHVYNYIDMQEINNATSNIAEVNNKDREIPLRQKFGTPETNNDTLAIPLCTAIPRELSVKSQTFTIMSH